MPSSNMNSEYVLPGLRDAAEILVDNWGVPHIYAQNRMDAFLVQGFQAARDRLFQIDLWRRRGLGLLAEVLGEDYVSQDRATRLFLFRGDMRQEWLSYSTDARDVVTAFVAGVNSYIDWTLEAPEERLPPEFEALGYHPSRWAPEDMLRIRTHGLLYNAEQELARALTLRDLGRDSEKLRSIQEPESPASESDTALFEHLDDSVLDVYRLAFAPVSFDAPTVPEPSTPSGSNNWVISGERTAHGRPVLANDPHRSIGLPSLRYLTHLAAPGLNVIGAGEPHLPGLSMGHNERVAFGMTIWPVDHEDLYIYELHPEDDKRYRYRGAWEEFTSITESSAVAGSEDIEHTLDFTRHGPVIFTDTVHRVAVALRAVWLEPGMVPYLGSLEFLDSQDAEEFSRSLRRWGAPGGNQVYATVDGDIGWQASAMVPKRPNWDGSLPVAGDGRFEWDGFASVEDLPSSRNPEVGWITTSNECNLPEDFNSSALPTSSDWYSSARHERLVEWLESGEDLDVDSSLLMQNDVQNHHAVAALRALGSIEVVDHRQVWSELQEWDGAESQASFPALVFQVWLRRHFRPWLVDENLSRLSISPVAAARARHRLLREDTLFSDLRPDMRMIAAFDLSDQADRDLLSEGIDHTLGHALDDIESRLGPDRDKWTWGALHQTQLKHPVFAHRPDAPEQWKSLPPVPRAGSGDTVGLNGYDRRYNAVMGSSFRMVLDVGEWDESRVINAPGQSGDPRSPNYSDLLSLWGADGAFPMLFSRGAIEAATSYRIDLLAHNAGDTDELKP